MYHVSVEGRGESLFSDEMQALTVGRLNFEPHFQRTPLNIHKSFVSAEIKVPSLATYFAAFFVCLAQFSVKVTTQC